MASLSQLAARNITRNKRRSALTLAAVSLGVASSVFIQAFVGGFLKMATVVLVDGRMGAIQVHQKGHLGAETDPLKLDMPLSPELMARLAAVPGVVAVAPRIIFEVMLGNGAQSTMALATAVDPVLEAKVCPHRWDAVEGKAFLPLGPDDVLVGRALLGGLAAAKGSTLNIQASTQAGAVNALDVHVLQPLGAMDPIQSKRTMELPLVYAQQLLGMQGRVSEYALAIGETVDLEKTTRLVRETLGDGYEVHTWLQRMPEMADGLESIATVLAFVIGFLFLLVLSGIANTMLMAVHERTREIGTMLAMGMRRGSIRKLFLLEALVLGLIGGVLGALLGTAIVALTHFTGIPLRPPESEVDNFLRPVGDSMFALWVAAGACLGAVLAALQPASRAAALSPVEALRNE